MRRIFLFALVLTTGILMSLSALASASGLVVGHYRSGTDSNANFSNPSFTATHESVVDLQPWDTQELYALKAADPNVKVLMYQNASGVSTSASSSGVYSSGVSYDQAKASGWLLHNTSGQPFTFDDYNWMYAADIGNSGYAQAWAANVLQKLSAAPWDGVMLDDVNPTIKYHYTPSDVAKYPTDAAYSEAMGSFLSVVGPKLQSAGKLAVANIGDWPEYESTGDSWLQYLSGAEDEMFTKWGDTPGSGYRDQGGWANQLQEVKLTASEHKIFLGITHSSNTDEQAATYGYATELLGAGGTAEFYMGDDATNETWFPEYNLQIGSPTGAETVDADGVHRRKFADGLVVVNPTTSTQSVSLGGVYSGSGVHNASTVTLRPNTGLVLSGSATALPTRARSTATRTAATRTAASRTVRAHVAIVRKPARKSTAKRHARKHSRRHVAKRTRRATRR